MLFAFQIEARVIAALAVATKQVQARYGSSIATAAFVVYLSTLMLKQWHYHDVEIS
jgi:hypothetical protein